MNIPEILQGKTIIVIRSIYSEYDFETTGEAACYNNSNISNY